MNDKLRVVLVGVIAGLVVLTMLLWSFVSLNKGDTLHGVFVMAIAIIILAIAVISLKRTYGSVKKGLPAEDERSKKVMTNALAKAYLISLFWLLAIGWASDNIIAFRDVSQAIGAGIAGMAVISGLCYLYVSRKEDIE
jgi:uncharacterized membrane protein